MDTNWLLTSVSSAHRKHCLRLQNASSIAVRIYLLLRINIEIPAAQIPTSGTSSRVQGRF